MTDLSRRNFVKGAALSAMGVAAVGLTACGSNGGSDTARNADAANISWDEEYEIVAVGSGLAGMSAALSVASEGNGAKCLLLEKSPSPLGGGNSPFSGGYVIYTDEKNYDDCLTYLKDLRGHFDTTPDDVLETYAKYLKENLEFVESFGPEKSDYALMEPGELHPPSPIEFVASCWPEYPEIASSTSVGVLKFQGPEMSTVSKFMLSAVEKNAEAITHKTSAPVTSLIQDEETKTILGVVYEEGGKEVKVKATNGVIMCCGGFENNPTMIQDYLSMAYAHPMAGIHNTGDCFPMCQKAGADFWHMNAVAGFWTHATTLDRSRHSNSYSTTKEYGIIVGSHGRRYFYDVDYGVGLDWRTTIAGGSTLETATAARHGHMNYGGEWPHTHQPEISWFIFDETHKAAALTGMTGELLTENVEEESWGYQADTIEALAEKMKVPAEEFTKTIDAWNKCCDDGYDSAFHRPVHYQTKITEPPFYAVFQEPVFINTDGGPKRNANGQIIDLDGNPIPNLYSAGEFGSLWCNMYQGGGNLGECIAFGRISVKHALGLDV